MARGGYRWSCTDGGFTGEYVGRLVPNARTLMMRDDEGADLEAIRTAYFSKGFVDFDEWPDDLMLHVEGEMPEAEAEHMVTGLTELHAGRRSAWVNARPADRRELYAKSKMANLRDWQRGDYSMEECLDGGPDWANIPDEKREVIRAAARGDDGPWMRRELLKAARDYPGCPCCGRHTIYYLGGNHDATETDTEAGAGGDQAARLYGLGAADWLGQIDTGLRRFGGEEGYC